METILSYYTEFQTLMKTNPILAGVFSLWGLTVITFILKVVPMKICEFIFTQCTTTMIIENCGGFHNEKNFSNFLKLFYDNQWSSFSRSLSFVSNAYFGDAILSAGVGKHIFIRNYRIFWFVMSTLNSQSTEKEKKIIKIYTIGRSHKAFEMLTDEFKYKPENSIPEIYSPEKDGWKTICKAPNRDINTIVINDSIRNKIIEDIDHLYSNMEWYISRGLPYKKTFILHGVPGTGKTSIISGLANKYRKNLCLINLNDVHNTELETLMRTIPKNSFVVFEDFDSASSTATRKPKDKNEKEKEFCCVDLTTILNVLDGVVRLDNVCLFMTTNTLESIDAAILRKGRVDHIYEIKPFQDKEVKDYIRLMYPDEPIPDVTFGDIVGCDIQALYMEHKEDYHAFVQELPVLGDIVHLSVKGKENANFS